jgi:hypothetical protein
MGGPPVLVGLGVGLTTPDVKKQFVKKYYAGLRNWILWNDISKEKCT